MSDQPQPKGLINIGTAMGLFALLTVWAIFALKGVALACALIVIVALAIKAYLHFLRSRMD